MNKKTSIILIAISVILLIIFAIFLVNNNTSNEEIKNFKGSVITVFYNDKELPEKATTNDNNEIIINMETINGKNEKLTIKQIEENYIVITKTYLDNILVYIYSNDKVEDVVGKDNTKEQLSNMIDRGVYPGDIKNTLDVSVTGVSYKDGTKLGNLIPGPADQPNTFFYPLSYAPYGTNIVHNELEYKKDLLPSENLENFAKAYSSIVNEKVNWNDSKKGFSIELNTVNGASVYFDEKNEIFSIASANIRFDFSHITKTINGEKYNGYSENNLLEDANGKTLLLALSYFGGKEYSERVFSLMDYYYFFSKNNDKPITKELVEKYDLTFVKEEPTSRYNGELETQRDLYVSYKDETWKITYDLGTVSALSVGLAIEIPVKLN